MSKILFILNDPPYGSERSYNGLRLAGSISKDVETEVRVFLMGDAVFCAKSGQKTPNGFYNIERMLRLVTNKNGKIGVCGTCLDARAVSVEELMDGAQHSTLNELTEWTLWAEKVIVF